MRLNESQRGQMLCQLGQVIVVAPHNNDRRIAALCGDRWNGLCAVDKTQFEPLGQRLEMAQMAFDMGPVLA